MLENEELRTALASVTWLMPAVTNITPLNDTQISLIIRSISEQFLI